MGRGRNRGPIVKRYRCAVAQTSQVMALGVTTMLTVTFAPTFIAPIEQVMELGVPLGVVHDPCVIEELVKGASITFGKTSEKFTLNAGSGPVFVITYL